LCFASVATPELTCWRNDPGRTLRVGSRLRAVEHRVSVWGIVGSLAVIGVGIAMLVGRERVRDWQLGVERLAGSKAHAGDEEWPEYVMRWKVIAPALVIELIGFALFVHLVTE
jgi:hypothetical protein